MKRRSLVGPVAHPGPPATSIQSEARNPAAASQAPQGREGNTGSRGRSSIGRLSLRLLQPLRVTCMTRTRGLCGLQWPCGYPSHRPSIRVRHTPPERKPLSLPTDDLPTEDLQEGGISVLKPRQRGGLSSVLSSRSDPLPSQCFCSTACTAFAGSRSLPGLPLSRVLVGRFPVCSARRELDRSKGLNDSDPLAAARSSRCGRAS